MLNAIDKVLMQISRLTYCLKSVEILNREQSILELNRFHVFTLDY